MLASAASSDHGWTGRAFGGEKRHPRDGGQQHHSAGMTNRYIRRGAMRTITFASAFLFFAAPEASFAQLPLPLTDLGTDRKLTVVYVVPKDRQPVDEFQERITVLLTYVNQLFREASATAGDDLAKHGLDFEFDDRNPKLVKVWGIKARKPTAFYVDDQPNSAQQYGKLADLVKASFGRRAKDRSFLVLAETYDPVGPADFEWKGGLALGGSHMAIFSAWILQEELCATTVEDQLKLLWDETPIPGRLALGHGRMDSPRFEFIEDGFGAVAHELGHSLGGLPHDDDEWSVMSNGFRRLQKNFQLQLDPSQGTSWDEKKTYFIPEHAARLRESSWIH